MIDIRQLRYFVAVAEEELAGLVYSETPKEDRTDPEAHRLPWYRSPLPLAGISLAMVTALNIIFR